MTTIRTAAAIGPELRRNRILAIIVASCVLSPALALVFGFGVKDGFALARPIGNVCATALLAAAIVVLTVPAGPSHRRWSWPVVFGVLGLAGAALSAWAPRTMVGVILSDLVSGLCFTLALVLLGNLRGRGRWERPEGEQIPKGDR